MSVATKKIASKPTRVSKTKKVDRETPIYSIRELDMIERIIRVEDKMLLVNSNIELLVHQMDKRFEDMQKYMDKRFEQVDKRFEQMDKRFEQMDKRFEITQRNMDTRFNELREDMNKRFTQMFAFVSIVFTVLGLMITVFRFVR